MIALFLDVDPLSASRNEGWTLSVNRLGDTSMEWHLNPTFEAFKVRRKQASPWGRDSSLLKKQSFATVEPVPRGELKWEKGPEGDPGVHLRQYY